MVMQDNKVSRFYHGDDGSRLYIHLSLFSLPVITLLIS